MLIGMYLLYKFQSSFVIRQIGLCDAIRLISPEHLEHPFQNNLLFLKPKLIIGKRAFTVAAPTTWNQVPVTIKSSETVPTFRKSSKHICLKMHFHLEVSADPCSNDESCLL